MGRKNKIQQNKEFRKTYKGRIIRTKYSLQEEDKYLGKEIERIRKECKLISEEEWYKEVGMENN